MAGPFLLRADGGSRQRRPRGAPRGVLRPTYGWPDRAQTPRPAQPRSISPGPFSPTGGIFPHRPPFTPLGGDFFPPTHPYIKKGGRTALRAPHTPYKRPQTWSLGPPTPYRTCFFGPWGPFSIGGGGFYHRAPRGGLAGLEMGLAGALGMISLERIQILPKVRLSAHPRSWGNHFHWADLSQYHFRWSVYQYSASFHSMILE